MSSLQESLTRKIEALTSEQLLEVEKLVDFLQADVHADAAMALSEPAFASVWNDPENDVYDAI